MKCQSQKPLDHRQLSSSMAIMMAAAILKLYAIGTALSVLAFIYGIADSFGGLMYAQNHHYIHGLDHQTQRQIQSRKDLRGPSVTRNIGS
ncbi:hypothetical protein CHARACLAT_004813 [Characodon lateralis]|uniref:Uncharacterized protein n=1 Tax=Characodon lateralis TaxID=208331 RepID=A0ABU7EGP0_9TELE|nr:hypothetical protein [Characodon lateralis]